MTAKIKYLCSEAGRKAHLMAGRAGDAVQTIPVQPDHSRYADVVAAAQFDRDGLPVLDTTSSITASDPHASVDATRWDSVPTVEEILANEEARRLKLTEKHRNAQTERTEKTLAVLRDRKTDSRSLYIDGCGWVAQTYPDWPHDRDQAVVGSDEAKAWQAELEAQNTAAREAAEKEAAEKAQAEADRKARAAEAEAVRRAELGLEDGDLDLGIEDGVLTEAPVWESHGRGKNWLAVISLDATAPGGLRRVFADKARGEGYYLLPTLKPGDAVEFGADYYSGKGRKSEKRWYGFAVRTVLDEGGSGYLVLRKAGTGKQAVKAGEKLAAQAAKAADKAVVVRAREAEAKVVTTGLEVAYEALKGLPAKEARKALAELRKRLAPAKAEAEA